MESPNRLPSASQDVDSTPENTSVFHPSPTWDLEFSVGAGLKGGNIVLRFLQLETADTARIPW